MGVFTYTVADFTSSVAPTRLFQAFCIDSHNFMPKVLPQFVKSVEIVQGVPTSVGCVKLIKLPDDSSYKYLKNRVDGVDEERLYFKYTTIEGDVLGDTLECAVYEYNFETVANNETHFKLVAHYHTKGDYIKTQEEVAVGTEAIEKMFIAAEEHLIANPQLYA